LRALAVPRTFDRTRDSAFGIPSVRLPDRQEICGAELGYRAACGLAALELSMHPVRVTLAAGLLAVACTKEVTPPPPAPAPPPPPPIVKLVAPEPPSASVSGKTDPECVGPFGITGQEGEVKIGKHTFRRTGAVLTLADGKADQTITFGVVANLKEPTAENLFNIKRYVDYFAEKKAEAILVAGDSGETKEEIVGSLEALAKSGLPVLAIPGNREARADFHAAVGDLTAKYPNVIDMSRIRLVKLDDASIISLPGYYDKRFMHTGDAGCQYFKEDVDRLSSIVEAATQPVILLAHAEPHGENRESIDAFQDGNAGDANLTAFLKTQKVPFGVFANIQEAGGRAMDLDSKLVKEGDAAEHVYLNPGLADSTDWPLNDGTQSHGMVATLTIKDGKGAYSVYRAKPLTDVEEAAAKKLVPAAVAPAVAAPAPKADK
jgi:Icc-related predicted phosphoesterase